MGRSYTQSWGSMGRQYKRVAGAEAWLAGDPLRARIWARYMSWPFPGLKECCALEGQAERYPYYRLAFKGWGFKRERAIVREAAVQGYERGRLEGFRDGGRQAGAAVVSVPWVEADEERDLPAVALRHYRGVVLRDRIAKGGKRKADLRRAAASWQRLVEKERVEEEPQTTGEVIGRELEQQRRREMAAGLKATRGDVAAHLMPQPGTLDAVIALEAALHRPAVTVQVEHWPESWDGP